MIAGHRGGVHEDIGFDETEAAAMRSRILTWFRQHGRDLPWRRTLDPYAILVSEIMLQQTQVSRVMPRYAEFLERFPSAPALGAADVADVLSLWSGLGYNNRALRLRDACRLVGERHGGVIPDDEFALRALPGVGPYTARAVQVFAWNRDVAAVDTNVRRVLVHELALDPDISDSKLAAVAQAVVPLGRAREWHHALMDYGALVATARATGIAPRGRQSRFQGSRRQTRGAVLRALLEHADGLAVASLARSLEVEPGRLEEALGGLERDGLLVRGPAGRVRLGEDR